MTEASDDRVLEALRHEWDGAYEFGMGSDGFWARRRDGLGGTLVSEDPGELRRMVSDDYAMYPPRSRPGGSGIG
jgi:hypothetical protein